MVLHLSFPNRPWVCKIDIEPAGKYNLEETEFLEALHGGYAARGFETVRLRRI